VSGTEASPEVAAPTPTDLRVGQPHWDMSQPQPPLGRVVATELKPSTPHQFHFWTARETPIGIGAIVRVEHEGRVVFGVVTDGFAYSDLVTPMHAVIGADGDPVAAGAEPSVRAEIRLFTAAVLRQIPEEPLQPVPLGPVWLASDQDVVLALRMDAYTGGERPTGIPVGLYAAGGLEAPVYLDCDFLLGPEAAHLNITGVSGLATKTSAVEFLLGSIFQTFPRHKGSVAALCFNVKGPDLCFLDQPATLSEEDRRQYARLGLRPEPFGDVHYYAPFKADGVNLNTLRTNEALAANTWPLVWGLREVLDYAEVVLNRDDVDAKADAFIDFLADRVVGREYQDDLLRGRPFQVQSFADLEEFFRAIFDFMEALGKGGEVWKTHHLATIRKIRNRLSNISTRSKGLVTDDGAAHDLPWGAFTDRSVHVVDVAGLDPLAQDLVFARVVSKLREHLERRDLGVDHVVVFVDELNKYAPAEGADTYVRKMLLDLSERGRYLGLVLFSAQQFRSQVQRRVVGNAGTAVFGRMDMDELSTPAYATLSPATKIKLATLPKGELMVRHPHFTQPIFVRFPRPAVLGNREGIELFPPAPELPFADAVARQLRGLDRRVAADTVRALVEGRREDDVRRALGATRRERPDDPLAFFRACLGRRVSPEIVPVRRPVPAVRRADDDYGF
jgi:DNA helicase HerA-like ATPase